MPGQFPPAAQVGGKKGNSQPKEKEKNGKDEGKGQCIDLSFLPALFERRGSREPRMINTAMYQLGKSTVLDQAWLLSTKEAPER